MAQAFQLSVKTPSTLFVSLLRLGCFFFVVFGAFAGTFNGKVSDLDAGNGYLTVTSDASQTTQTFKVTSQTAIVSVDGKSGQLLDLIEGTLVVVEADPGDGKLAAKITVLPNPSQEPP
jgi:LysM repeat protein